MSLQFYLLESKNRISWGIDESIHQNKIRFGVLEKFQIAIFAIYYGAIYQCMTLKTQLNFEFQKTVKF